MRLRAPLLALALACLGCVIEADAEAATYNVVTGYGAVGDAVWVEDAVTTSGSNIVTSASAGWTSGAVGKTLWVTQPAHPSTTYLAQTTITQYDSPTQVRTAANATTSGSGGTLVWGTDDTAAFTSAFAAALATGRKNTILVPSRSYVITGRIYNCTYGEAPNFVNEDGGRLDLHVSPDIAIPGDGSGVVLHNTRGGLALKGVTFWGPGKRYAMSAGQGVVHLQGNAMNLEDVQVLQFQGTDSGAAGANFYQAQRLLVKNLSVYTVNGSGASTLTGISISYSAGVFVSTFASNMYRALDISHVSTRRGLTVGASDGPMLNFYGGWLDENSGSANVNLHDDAEVNFDGMKVWTGGEALVYAMNVDGTSKAWITKGTLLPYSTVGGDALSRALSIASGGIVRASMTTFGCSRLADNISVANSGKFIDLGGNDFKNGGTTTWVAVPWRQAFSSPTTVVRQ